MSSRKWHKMAIKSVGKSRVYRGFSENISLDKRRKVWYMFRFWCKKMRRQKKMLDKAIKNW